MKTAALAKWLQAIALALPRSHAPGEEPEAEAARIEIVAESIAEAAAPYADGKGWTASELGLALLLKWGLESRFDERVQAGKPHPKWHSDHGASRCAMQIQMSRLVPQEEWEQLAGTDMESTRRCAAAGARVWVAQARRCGVWYGRRADRVAVEQASAAYGTGGQCVPGKRDRELGEQWERFIVRRFDQGPPKGLGLDGYRRAGPREVPPELSVLELERELLDGEVRIGFVRNEQSRDGRMFALVIERHARGKVGVSVFVATASAAPP